MTSATAEKIQTSNYSLCDKWFLIKLIVTTVEVAAVS